MSVLNIENLYFNYGKHAVLKNINLDVNDGQVILLLGPNGCGKTTLLDCIAGYKKPSSGKIYIEKKSDRNYKTIDRAKKVAYVAQAVTDVFPFSVLDIVLMGRTPNMDAMSGPSKKDIAIAEQALDRLGILEFKDRIFLRLSGGEKQLVMIARCIAQDSKIVLLDEPTSSLDIKNEMMVLDRIYDMVSSIKKTVIITTHQPNHAFFFSNKMHPVKVALFKDKTIKYFDNTNEVIKSDIMNEIYNINCKIIEYEKGRKALIVQ